MSLAQNDDRRRSRRFPLWLNAKITKVSDRYVELDAETRNVSSSGAYLAVPGSAVSEGAALEFLLTLIPGPADKPVLLSCKGRVTRKDDDRNEGCCGVAATIDRYQFIREPAVEAESE